MGGGSLFFMQRFGEGPLYFEHKSGGGLLIFIVEKFHNLKCYKEILKRDRQHIGHSCNI